MAQAIIISRIAPGTTISARLITHQIIKRMPVTFHNQDTDFRLPNKRRVAAWVRETITSEGFVAGDIACIFCSCESHLEINRRYLGHDYYTDVITFDYTDYEGKIVSGDIFIDPQTVASNALLMGTEPSTEMLRVVIHGVLHLCGHGDKTPAEEKKMRALEDRYLKNCQAV